MPVALVTGGGRGIGRTLAGELTAAGWTVVVTGRTPAALDDAVASGDAALGVPGDASEPLDVRAAVAQARALGDLELAVANAGAFRSAGPLWESDPDLWWEDATVNLRGPALLLHGVLGEMVERGRGRVVVLGSGYGVEALPFGSSYSAAKTAVHRLVETVALELAGTGVSAFAVSPGLVASDMTDFPEELLVHHPDLRGKARREGRPPEQVARLVVELAAGGRDSLSGRYLHVRDDLDALQA
jgi:NAD(P)-dependent dehydrogenase (short-subunit alcohol dehydrogenase family)